MTTLVVVSDGVAIRVALTLYTYGGDVKTLEQPITKSTQAMLVG